MLNQGQRVGFGGLATAGSAGMAGGFVEVRESLSQAI